MLKQLYMTNKVTRYYPQFRKAPTGLTSNDTDSMTTNDTNNMITYDTDNKPTEFNRDDGNLRARASMNIYSNLLSNTPVPNPRHRQNYKKLQVNTRKQICKNTIGKASESPDRSIVSHRCINEQTPRPLAHHSSISDNGEYVECTEIFKPAPHPNTTVRQTSSNSLPISKVKLIPPIPATGAIANFDYVNNGLNSIVDKFDTEHLCDVICDVSNTECALIPRKNLTQPEDAAGYLILSQEAEQDQEKDKSSSDSLKELKYISLTDVEGEYAEIKMNTLTNDLNRARRLPTIPKNLDDDSYSVITFI